MSNSAQDEFNALYNRENATPSTHPEDVSASSDNDSTTLHSANDDDLAFDANYAAEMSATYHIPSTAHFDANTGPKGVIADARNFESAKKRSFRQTLQALSNCQTPPLFGKQKKSAFNFSREKSASPENSADDEEDEFMRTWRANRLDELASMSKDLRTRRQSPSQRKYGTLIAVDPSGYLDAVEKVPTDTIVVVLIYDDEVWCAESICARYC